MDRAGRLAAGCLLLLVAGVPCLPQVGAWAPADDVAALLLALLGGAALWWEARAGAVRPALGTPLDLAFGAWLGLAVLSALDAERPAIARYELGRQLALGLAWLLAVRTLRTPAHVRRLLVAALASAAVIGAAGLAGYAAFVEAGAPEASRSGWLSTPFFGHSYLAAQYVLLPLVAGLVLLLERERPARERLGLALLVLPALGFVVVTGSRGALLALAVALFTAALLRAGARRAGRRRVSLLVGLLGKGLLVLLAAGALLLLLGRTGALGGAADLVGARFAALFDAEQARTSFSRLAVWHAGLLLAGEHPLTGVGTGGFGMLAAGRIPSLAVVPHAHNQFVQVVAENGVLALAALLALVRAAQVVARRGAARLEHDPARRALFHALGAALVAALVSGCFETPLLWTESGLLVVTLLAAFGRAGCDVRERVAPPRARHAAVLVVAALLVAALPVWWRMLPALAQSAHAHRAFADARSPADTERALELLERAEARFPHHPRIAELGARVATRLRRLDDALAWQRLLLERVPDAPAHLRALGELLLRQGRPDAAVEPLRAALARWPAEGRTELLARLAEAAGGAGRLEQAHHLQQRLLGLGWHHAHPELLREAARVLLWLRRDPLHARALLTEYVARVPSAAHDEQLAALDAELLALARARDLLD